MDSITHILSAALLTEPVSAPKGVEAPYSRWRERMAVVVGALILDCDGVLGWIDPALYAKYHRVATHSVGGLIFFAFVAALIARNWPERWLTLSLRNRVVGAASPSFRRLLAFSGIAVTMHWVGDWITAWGIQPFWPFSDRDFCLYRVNSLEPGLLGLTLVSWAVQNQLLRYGKRKSAWITAFVWLVLCAVYVYLRPYFMEPAYV